MTIRTVTIAVASVDVAGWLVVAAATFLSGSDPATKGLDNAAGLAVTVLLLATGAPALVLALRGRAARLALMLALIFPAALALLFVAAVVALA
jgi:hypothetical protein